MKLDKVIEKFTRQDAHANVAMLKALAKADWEDETFIGVEKKTLLDVANHIWRLEEELSLAKAGVRFWETLSDLPETNKCVPAPTEGSSVYFNPEKSKFQVGDRVRHVSHPENHFTVTETEDGKVYHTSNGGSTYFEKGARGFDYPESLERIPLSEFRLEDIQIGDVMGSPGGSYRWTVEKIILVEDIIEFWVRSQFQAEGLVFGSSITNGTFKVVDTLQ